ncbi:MAG: hypothetical protein MI743_15840 [Sneathiellales bacterium]|nr:hypothetical protein [Sneathiellales bacterium]
MLDQTIQFRLKPLKNKSYRGIVIPAILVVLSAAIALTTFFEEEEGLARSDLSKLTVLAAESLEESPAALWTILENEVGRPHREFTPADTVKAARFLIKKIDPTRLEKAETLIGGLDY